MINRDYISEGFRILKRAVSVQINGIKRYPGNAEDICQQIVNDCWNGRYFQTSIGHFCEFYTRDFGWCTYSLLRLGYKEEVVKTLDYALTFFEKHQKITTTITPSGKPINVFHYSPDSLPFLLRSLRLAKADFLVEKYKDFLDKEIIKYYDVVLDKEKGIVKENVKFSSIKDHFNRQSSLYDNIMLCLLSEEINKSKLFENPFKNYNFKKIIKEKFWTGSYFLDDLSGSRHIAGDANVFPFYLGIFDDKNMLKKAIEKIIDAKLDEPFPLKYTNQQIKSTQKLMELLTPNYEGTAIWTHLGPMYLSLLKKVNKNRYTILVEKYDDVIEKYGNYLEVFNPNGSVYRTPFYYSDEGMLWAANYLVLINKKVYK